VTKNSQKKYYSIAKPKKSWWSLFKKMKLSAQISLIFSISLILSGTLGLIVLGPRLIAQNQDIRQQAATAVGQVTLVNRLRQPLDNQDYIDRSNSTLTFDQNIIDLYLDTKNIQTDSIQLVFELWPLFENQEMSSAFASVIAQAPEFQINPDLNLKITNQEIEQKGLGYLIVVTLKPLLEASTFSTPNETRLASVKFAYLSQESAQFFLNESNLNQTSLSNLPGLAVSFDNEKSIVSRHGSDPIIDDLQYVTRTSFSGPIINNSAITPAQSLTVAGCNETCISNHQCSSGLACYSGRCRNPLNLESASCNQANSETANSMSEKCDQRCDFHRDCPANMLCHTSSQSCRLATNPGSLSCSPSSTKTVSTLYDEFSGDAINELSNDVTITTESTSEDLNLNSDSELNADEERELNADSELSADSESKKSLEDLDQNSNSNLPETFFGSFLEKFEKLSLNAQHSQSSGQNLNQSTSLALPELGVTINGIFISIYYILSGLVGVGVAISSIVIALSLIQNKKTREDLNLKTGISSELQKEHDRAAQVLKDKIDALKRIESHTKNEVSSQVSTQFVPKFSTHFDSQPPIQTLTQTLAQEATQNKVVAVQKAMPTLKPNLKPNLTPTPLTPISPESMLQRIKKKNIGKSIFSSKSIQQNNNQNQLESAKIQDTNKINLK
jgi:hypothetical protein